MPSSVKKNSGAYNAGDVTGLVVFGSDLSKQGINHATGGYIMSNRTSNLFKEKLKKN
jgi:hypothetical protein